MSKKFNSKTFDIRDSIKEQVRIEDDLMWAQNLLEIVEGEQTINELSDLDDNLYLRKTNGRENNEGRSV